MELQNCICSCSYSELPCHSLPKWSRHELMHLLVGDLAWYPVTPAMGKPSFNGQECIKEIQLKTEGKNPISNFLLIKKEQESNTEEKSSFDQSLRKNLSVNLKAEPIKEIKEEQESSLEEKYSSDKSDLTNLPKSLKEEPVTADDINIVEKGEHDAKLLSSKLSDKDATKCSQKLDYEEFLADSKPATDTADKLGKSPLKGNLKDAGGKQPTLFSYFGKK